MLKVLCDNMSMINLTKNLVYYSRIKHIEVKYHFIRHHMAWGNITIDYVDSKSNLTNILTKPLLEAEFNTLRRGLGMCLMN